MIKYLKLYSVKPVLRDHFWDKEKAALQDRWPLKRGAIHMKYSLTGQEKCDLLIQWLHGQVWLDLINLYVISNATVHWPLT
jgi:hypothetical protein